MSDFAYRAPGGTAYGPYDAEDWTEEDAAGFGRPSAFSQVIAKARPSENIEDRRGEDPIMDGVRRAIPYITGDR